MPYCSVKDCTVEKAKYNFSGIRTNCVCHNHADSNYCEFVLQSKDLIVVLNRDLQRC